MADAAARRLLHSGIGNHRLAAEDALAGNDQRWPGGREIDIGAAAEADEPEALPGDRVLAGRKVADDATGHEPGDLHHGDFRALGGGDADRHALILLARFVQARI